MIRISLDNKERENLKKLRLNRKSNTGERAYYVLLCAEGKSPPEIAKHCRRNIHTIRLWLNNYIDKGIDGLASKKPPGRLAKKSPIIEEKIEELLSKSPQEFGYKEAGWQINILKDYFSKELNCSACDNTIKAALNKKGFVFKRFSKTMPVNAPSSNEKKEAVTNMIEKIQTTKASGETEILFIDESHFSNQPYVSRGWFKKGKKNGKYSKK